jgi:hypothetical protein
MRVYIKRDIYFNPVVSDYFTVPFSNQGASTKIIAAYILGCAAVTWDVDTRRTLEALGDQEVTLLGKGSGVWEIYADQIPQNKPDTDRWNNPEEDDDPQKENGRSAAKNLDRFLKDTEMMFV